MVAALVDSYYYRGEIYVLKSGNDFVSVRKRHLKNQKKHNPTSFNGKGVNEVINNAIATLMAGSVVDCQLQCDTEKYEMMAAKQIASITAGRVQYKKK